MFAQPHLDVEDKRGFDACQLKKVMAELEKTEECLRFVKNINEDINFILIASKWVKELLDERIGEPPDETFEVGLNEHNIEPLKGLLNVLRDYKTPLVIHESKAIFSADILKTLNNNLIEQHGVLTVDLERRSSECLMLLAAIDFHLRSLQLA